MDLLTGVHEFFDLCLVDEGVTFTYSFVFRGELCFVETVADPSARELVDVLLWFVRGLEGVDGG